MDITIQSESRNGQYISIVLRGNSYTVAVFPEYEEGFCGYPTKKLIYTDLQKAKRSYNRIIKTL